MSTAAGKHRRRRVVVCGATGFIGRNVAERLAARDDLEIVGTRLRSPAWSRSGVRFVEADLRDPAEAARVVEGADVVVHAAASTSGAADIVRRPEIHVTDNAVLGSVLLRAAHEAGVGQLVFFSCSVVYPSREKPWREDEMDPADIPAPYFGAGWTKLYLERTCEFFARQGRTRFTVLRHANVYGPHDRLDPARSHVFAATVRKVLEARDGRIVVWGDGSEARDLLHVSDLARCVELAIDRQQEPFLLCNVGSGEAVQVRSLVERIAGHAGRALRIEHDLARPTLPTSLALDSRLARSRLGWEPTIDLDTGIASTLEWARARLARAS